jgi:hypothetical protein
MWASRHSATGASSTAGAETTRHDGNALHCRARADEPPRTRRARAREFSASDRPSGRSPLAAGFIARVGRGTAQSARDSRRGRPPRLRPSGPHRPNAARAIRVDQRYGVGGGQEGGPHTAGGRSSPARTSRPSGGWGEMLEVPSGRPQVVPGSQSVQKTPMMGRGNHAWGDSNRSSRNRPRERGFSTRGTPRSGLSHGSVTVRQMSDVNCSACGESVLGAAAGRQGLRTSLSLPQHRRSLRTGCSPPMRAYSRTTGSTSCGVPRRAVRDRSGPEAHGHTFGHRGGQLEGGSVVSVGI